jgi:phage repressor protein C with HTH and peptisase S24 domain
MSLSERIRAAMATTGITQAELARACGVKPPSVSGWLSGKSKFLRGENLLQAARALKVNEDWLATGKGEMMGAVQTVHELDDDGFAAPSPDVSTAGQRVGIGEPGRTVPIRAVKIKVQAGSDGYVTEPDFDIDHGYFQVPAEVIETLGVDPLNLIVTTFRGRSMEPMYFDGGQGLVDVSKRKPVNNECFVVNWNGETLVKCLIKKSDGWCLYSFNRDYPSISVRDGYCSIIGMVVWQPARIVKGLL